ncbi:MAG: response regulator transcription factor [Atopobiaceae bacterium]|nr:response regulator transcription factor [Atopobiaceae bacterium]
MYRILIVEDEDAAATLLQQAISRYGEDHGEHFQTMRLSSAIELDEHVSAACDLIFLDIETPGQNGMDAAFDLRRSDTSIPIVFVTNLAQYAVHGYAVNALDFIVKPFTYEDFSLRMDRAMQVVRQKARRTLTVRSRDGLRMFDASSLVYVDLREHDLVYHLDDGTALSVRGSMRHLDDELGGSPFLRISSGCIVNMGHVRGISDAVITLSNGDTVWASRANKRHVLEEIAVYLGSGA